MQFQIVRRVFVSLNDHYDNSLVINGVLRRYLLKQNEEQIKKLQTKIVASMI